jgi:UDP-N-acetylmuramoyl-L-alanyl-D-glutamate--2,6-diaminopimelate ligase
MKLGELARTLKSPSQLSGDEQDRQVADIAYDSRKVKPGSLFVAVRGFNSDGHRFISQAIEQGATAVVAEFEDRAATAAGVPQIIVGDSRTALATAADLFFGHPSQALALIGVTGTNGKTTTTYLVKAIIEAAGHAAGLIGTIDYRVGTRVYPAPNTTPESLDLQRLLREMVSSGASHCVMEVSSHALELGRTAGCVFSTVAFTNLTQDHLDFHETMDAYFRAKLRLFTTATSRSHAVINWDDAFAEEIIRATKAAVLTTGMTDRAAIHPVGAISHGMHGLTFTVSTPAGPVDVESSLVGRHNVYNILTAIGVGTASGFSPAIIAHGIRQ